MVRMPAPDEDDPGSVDLPPGTALDLAERQAAPPLYRAGDKTQEWAENDWWHQRVDEMTADLVAPDRFWRDLAAWDRRRTVPVALPRRLHRQLRRGDERARRARPAARRRRPHRSTTATAACGSPSARRR